MLDRYKGAVLGHLIADSLGAPHTIKDAQDIPIDLELVDYLDAVTNTQAPSGHPTDDGSQLICLGESLVTAGFDPEVQYDYYLRWFRNGFATRLRKAIGYGGQTARLFRNHDQLDVDRMRTSDPKIKGSGGLMRTLAIPLYYRTDSIDLVINKAKVATAVTHNNDEVMLYSAVYSVLIALILQGQSKQEALVELESIFEREELVTSIFQKDLPSMETEGRKKILKISDDFFTARSTLITALWAWQTTNNYADAVVKAIKVGVNTDTFGAVTGGLAGATNGVGDIPQRWLEGLLMKKRLVKLAANLYGKSLSK